MTGAGQRRPDAGLGPQAVQLLQGALQLHGAGQLDGAAKLYQQILGLHPEHGPTLNFLGLLLHQAGQAAAALGFVERAIAADRRDPAFHVCRAQILIALGRPADALEACERALKLDPNQIDALNQRAVLLIQLGRPTEARLPLERAARRQPNNPALHANLGELLRTLGDLDGALAACRTAVTLAPQLAEAHLLLGNVQRDRNDLAAALASFDAAIKINPKLTVAHHNRATALRTDGQLAAALAGFRNALAADPTAVDTKTAIGGCLIELVGGPFDARFRSDLAAALREAWMRPEALAYRAVAALKSDPTIAALIAWAHGTETDVPPAAAAALADPLFGALLEACVVPDPALERTLIRLRARLLDAATGLRDAWPESAPVFAAALAVQCFNNDHAFAESSAETAQVAQLAAAIDAAAQPDALALVALACYRPLHRVAGADRLLAQTWDMPVQRVLAVQIAEPREEARLRPTIPTIGTITDAVSQAVQAQYEENPYPRWTRMPLGGTPMRLRARLAAGFPRLGAQLAEIPDEPDVLIAGCGTGWHPIEAARGNLGARVLAIDLSLTSLAYAQRKANELGVPNVTFRHADMLEIGGIDQRFDLIEAAGSLQCMDDPMAGWRVLCGLLKPHGIMRIALYSEIGRRNVVAARALIEQRGYASDAAGMRSLRAEILAMAPDTLLGSLTLGFDFYSLSGCRDLLFHVKEHRHTIPQIAGQLAELGLELVGFEHPHPAPALRYRAAHPDDPDMVDLDRWAAFEEAHPDTFANMYNMCLRRKP